jgi:hypothetical protein
MIEYNNYPKSVKPRVLNRGEVVEYELVNLKKDVMDNTGRGLAIPQVFGIPNSDIIQVQDEEGNPFFMNIGFITTYNSDGTPVFGNIHFTKANAGVIRLVGGKAQDQKQFEFMELTNWNADSPYRDKTVKAEFRKVNHKKRSEERRDIRNLKKQAFKAAEALTTAQVAKIYIGLGHKELTDESIMRDKIEELADVNPEKFLISSQNPDFDIMEIAFQAEKKKLISVDYAKGQIKGQTGEVLYSWGQTSGDVNWMEKFVSFVKSDEGVGYYRELIEALKPKAKVK